MAINEHIQPGRIVTVTQGRDAGKHAVIIGAASDKHVWIADGDKRKFDRPKRKNIMHLHMTDIVSREVADSIRDTGRVTNGKIRFALSRYMEQQLDG